jgi:hypothetical protein
MILERKPNTNDEPDDVPGGRLSNKRNSELTPQLRDIRLVDDIKAFLDDPASVDIDIKEPWLQIQALHPVEVLNLSPKQRQRIRLVSRRPRVLPSSRSGIVIHKVRALVARHHLDLPACGEWT